MHRLKGWILTKGLLMPARSPLWTLLGQPDTPFPVCQSKGTLFTQRMQELEGRVPTGNCVLGMRL